MSEFDYRAQLEHLLSHQWFLVCGKIGLPQQGLSNTQPIQERLGCALESLAEQGKTSEEAMGIVKHAVCSVLGDKWEKEAKTLLEGLEWKKPALKSNKTSPSMPGPGFGKGRASTGLTTRYSTPTLVSSNSPKASPAASQHQHLKKCASSGQLPRPLRPADVSHTSISESGYNSLNNSSTEAQLRQILHQNTEAVSASGTSSKSTSCPVTPRHQGSSSTASLPPLPHSSPHLSPSQSHTALAQSKSLGCSPTTSLTEIIQIPGKRQNGNMISHATSPSSTKHASTQVHRHPELPTVLEGSDSVQSDPHSSSDSGQTGSGNGITTEICETLARLTEKVDDLASREYPSPKTTSREVQTDSDGNKRGRVCSDTTAMRVIHRKPKLGQTHKAHSAGDVDGVTTDAMVMKNYSPLPSIRELPKHATKKEEGDIGDSEHTATSTCDDPLQQCLQEDLTKAELVTIANEISPNILIRLSAILHKKTHVYDDLKNRYPHHPHEDIAFRVLETWYESVPAGPTNRAALVTALKKLGKLRLCHAIATKTYT